ncbi:MAG: PAS domain S-box protein [Deltaproteobacteria bacterium]|nr:PAS domain S-box protein [Deltaproteobacteria bacterium]
MSGRTKFEELQDKIHELEERISSLLGIEEKLRSSEELYRLLADNMADVIWTMDLNLNRTYVSPSVMNLSGHTVEEVMELPLEKVFTPESVKIILSNFEEVTDLLRQPGYDDRKNKSRTLELEEYCKDGSTIFTELTISYLRDKDGKPSGFLGTTKNITARKKAELALLKAHKDIEKRVHRRTAQLAQANKKLADEIQERMHTELSLLKSEQNYRILAENITDNIWTFDLKENKLKYISPSIKYLLGYTPQEAIKLNAKDIASPHTLKKIRTILAEELENEKNKAADQNRSITLEIELFHKNGTTVQTEVNIKFQRDANGKALGLLGITRDITQRKKTLTALRQSEERFRTIFMHNPMITVLWQRTGTDFILLDYNKVYADFTNGNIQNFVGKKASELYNSDSELFQILDKSFRNKSLIELEAPYKFHSVDANRLLHFFSYYVPPDLVLVHAQDVTDSRRSSEYIHALTQQIFRVQETERNKIACDLHDNIAQELSTARIMCDTLFDNKMTVDDAIQKKLSEISQRIQFSVSAVRELSYNLRPPSLDQLGLVKTIHLLCQDFSDTHFIPVDYYCAGLDNLQIDSEIEINLYRIVQEALNNIRKHAQADSILIRLVASNPFIFLRIEDNGKGFDINNLPNLILDEKRLGIQSMQERTYMIDGKFEINPCPGKGTRIFVEIPIKEKPDV